MMLGDVGDVLLATPALQRLRREHPAARITAMTKPSTIAVLARSGLVDDFLPVQKHLFDRPSALLRPGVLIQLLRYVLDLRGRRFDAVVLLHHLVTVWGTIKFALLALASGASIRAGLDNGRGLFLTHRVRDRGFGAVHESAYWRQVVALLSPSSPDAEAATERTSRAPTRADAQDAAAGTPSPGDDIPDTADAPLYIIPDESHCQAKAILKDAGIAPDRPVLAVHPGSGTYSTARRWFPERFAAAADLIAARHGLAVIVVGTPDERALAEQVVRGMNTPAANLAGRTTLDELAALLRRCALVIGNDSGVGHLAAAVGTPVVSIFGPFNHEAWRPLGRSLVVRAEPALPCMPCVNRGTSRGDPRGCTPRYCLQAVTPAMVAAAAERLL